MVRETNDEIGELLKRLDNILDLGLFRALGSVKGCVIYIACGKILSVKVCAGGLFCIVHV